MEQASDGVVAEYVYRKVISNIQVISEEFNDIMECKIIELNGEEFNFASFNILKDPEWLSSQLSHRIQSNIHGDLTLENIILSGPRSGEQNWYLIDPNPENIFQSPLIDFSKIMQSLHLGYEALRNKPQASFIRNRLSVNLHRSFQYEKIYSHFNARLHDIYDDKCVKQIYLHEIINYLRLIPYQLQNNREAGLAFFACLCILVRENACRLSRLTGEEKKEAVLSPKGIFSTMALTWRKLLSTTGTETSFCTSPLASCPDTSLAATASPVSVTAVLAAIDVVMGSMVF
jgi:hypothetical protein